jgi:hypothetical protein
MGKSTLAATLAQAGLPLLADDCSVIDIHPNDFVVQPSYPSVRMWGTSSYHLFGPDADGEPFAHYTDKLRYSRGLEFAEQAARVRAIVSIQHPAVAHPNRFALELQRGHAACGTVLSGAKSLPIDQRKPEAIHALVDLAMGVPVARMRLPDDLTFLPTARDRLVDWMAAL